ncbi:hypothetical protein BG015_004687 [Linnemannia schmuckeri]|uniref:Fungal specific transcription factor n=1 Tax=Linnemannia schmuckeri TaxID=64567 RepID=A0A9P5S1X6_9FUNG|nr:hypothetical protein BG015_004687 [Linnemannia schmuckeri]
MSSSSSSSQQSPATNNNNQNDQTEEHQDSSSKPVLALPAPGDFSSMSSDAPALEVNGQDIKLDLLGPVVVNEDGTMSRIDNWHEMADIEKANVRRILLKRNATRLARLRAERDQAIADEEAAAAAASNDK